MVLNKRIRGKFNENYLFWRKFKTSLGEEILVGWNLFCEKIGLYAYLSLEYAIVMSQQKEGKYSMLTLVLSEGMEKKLHINNQGYCKRGLASTPRDNYRWFARGAIVRINQIHNS